MSYLKPCIHIIYFYWCAKFDIVLAIFAIPIVLCMDYAIHIQYFQTVKLEDVTQVSISSPLAFSIIFLWFSINMSVTLTWYLKLIITNICSTINSSTICWEQYKIGREFTINSSTIYKEQYFLGRGCTIDNSTIYREQY